MPTRKKNTELSLTYGALGALILDKLQMKGRGRKNFP